jgi:hypothetical protein
MPFGGEMRGKALACSLRCRAAHPIHGKHEGGEVTAACQAKGQVLVTLLLLVFLQDLCWILAAVGRCIRVGDPDVKDCRRAVLPESVRGNVASQFWEWFSVVAWPPDGVPTCMD